MLSRASERVLTEHDVAKNTAEVLRNHKYVFALCSSTDMERLASFRVACRRINRVFLVDAYQEALLGVFSAHTKSPLFDFKAACKLVHYRAPRVKSKLRQQGFLMPVRASHVQLVKALMQTYDDTPSFLIYSMWQGYHNGAEQNQIPEVIEMRNLFKDQIFDGTHDGFHTTGTQT